MNITSPPEIIQGTKVILKKHQSALAQTMFDYVDQDRKRLEKFLPWVKLSKNLQDTINYIKHTHNSWDTGSLFDYSLFDLKTDTYLGNIGVHSIFWESQVCEVGYWILSKFEGQGLMSDALKTLEKELFNIGFNRIEIRCSNLNERSENIPKYNNYVLEGELRQNRFEMGKFRNTKIFSKLKADYNNS